MKITTLSGERTVHFPQTPANGFQHSEHGRTWQWVEVGDGGMWRSVSGGIAGGGGPITWDEILAKPEGIEALGNSGIIIGGTYSGD